MKKPTDNQIKEFKRSLKKVLSFDPSEIKDETLSAMFANNFDSNLALAERILFLKYDEIKKREYEIANEDKAVSMYEEFRDDKLPILLVTDNDSDGSQAQAAMFAAKDFSGDFSDVDIQFAQNLNEKKNVHGITKEVVEAWAEKSGHSKKSKFLVMTADNGIQSKDEVEAILKDFPNAKIIITDHHLPDDEHTPKESSRLVIYNPKYKSKGFLKENPHLNISGAATLSHLIKAIVKKSKNEAENDFLEIALSNIEAHSNSMDFVKASLQDYPLKPHDVEQNTRIRSLLNINNSVKSFVSKTISDDVLDRVSGLNKDFDKNKVSENVGVVKELNHYSKILLSVVEDYQNMDSSERKMIDSAVLNTMIQKKIATDDTYNLDKVSINSNYIEQLRPFVFYAMSNPNKDAFSAEMSEVMVDVFTKLKKVERGLIDEFKKMDLMHVVKRDNSSILYAKDPDMIRDLQLGRKLMMKVYNEHNRGTMLFMTGEEPNSKEGARIMNGSGRSIEMPLQEFCEKMEELQPELSFRAKGHDLAAGIFIESKKRLTPEKINMLADVADSVVSEYKNNKLKEDSSYDQEIYYVCDTTNIGKILEFNTAIAGYLPNQKSIEPLMKINRSTRFINRETGKPETVGQMLKNNNYGYKTIEVNFKGDVVIFGTEVIRSLAENNYKDYVKLSQMDGGSLIAQSIVEKNKINPKNLVVLSSEFKENKKELERSIDKLKENDYVIPLSRDQLKDTEIIKRNLLYGEKEFNEFESMVLSIMDQENLDVYGVLDTEGLGFGAAFAFNIGVLNVKKNKESGIEIPTSEYLEAKKSGELQKLQDKYTGGKIIRNIKVEDSNIIVNREIEADMVAILLKDKNTHIPESIAHLTQIDQPLLNKHGMDVSDADSTLYEMYKDLKVLFIAHNAGYDQGVLMASNLPKFTSMLGKNCRMVDSAAIAKEQAIGYADMDVTQIGNLQSALFFDNEHSEYTLSAAIAKDGDFTFPSLRGDFILRRVDKNYYLIDKEKRVETKLPYSDAEMRDGSALYKKPMPRNRVKYSVQFLLNNLAIRSMLLDQVDEKTKLVEPDEGLVKLGIQDEFIDFCVGYNFGGDFSKNLYNFLSHLKEKDIEEYKSFKEKIFDDEVAAQSYFEMSSDEIKKHNLKVSKDVDKKITKVEKKYKKLIDENPANVEGYYNKMSKEIDLLEKEKEDKSLTFDALDCLAKNLNNFIGENKEIYSKYVNNWEYQLLLSVHDPKKGILAKDDLERIEYQTGLDGDRIKRMHKEIYDYKKKVGIGKDSFFVKELHNNLDERGDMTIEHFAVALSVLVKYYNRYSNNAEQATNVILNSYKETEQMLYRRFHVDNVQNVLSVNSSTKAQLDNVARGEHGYSDYIQSAKNISGLRIQNGNLQAGMSIVGEKSTSEVSLDEVNEIESDINFVISYNLILNSSSKLLITTDYVDKYILDKGYKKEGELFYESNIYDCADIGEIKDRLEAEDVSKDEISNIEGIYKYFKSIESFNDFNKKNISEILKSQKEEFVEAYKRVYDKIGYFYVDNAKKEVKDIIDSLYANALSNTHKVKINPKSMTSKIADNVVEMGIRVLNMVDSSGDTIIDPEIKMGIMSKLGEIPVIDEHLSDCFSAMEKLREQMDEDDFDIKLMAPFMPLMFLGTRKLDPVKEITRNYDEILSNQLNKKSKKDVALDSKHKISKP